MQKDYGEEYPVPGLSLTGKILWGVYVVVVWGVAIWFIIGRF
jgi:hypothetical protein